MTVAHEQRRTDDAFREDDPGAIRAEISETRERISQDLDEIGERLNPHNVKADIKDGIREATIGRVEEMARQAGERLSGAGSGIVQTIRDNPLPAAVAGIGLLWLFTNRDRNSSQQMAGRPPEQSTVDTARDTVGKAKEKVGELAEQAQDAVAQAATPPVEGVRSTFQENPLAIAAGAVALGLAIGLLAPATRSEKRVLADVGESVVDKVSEVAKEATEKAQHVAQRAMEETKTAARDEGLTSSGG